MLRLALCVDAVVAIVFAALACVNPRFLFGAYLVDVDAAFPDNCDDDGDDASCAHINAVSA